MFFSHFCHNYHQNYHNYHHNYHCNHHYHHQQKKIGHTRKTSFLTSKKEVARIGVRGGGFRWFGQCPKRKRFFSIEAFPNVEESCLEGPTWNREDMNNKEVATTSSGCKFWQTNPLVLLWYIKCQDQSVSSACSGLHHSLILCTLYPKFCVCAWYKFEIWVGTEGQKYECCA